MAYGQKTANVMDIPLSISSVVAPHLSDNNYKWDGLNKVRVLSIDNGSLADYDEEHATAPFGSPSLVVPNEQELTLAYNKSMLLRIQKTQMQDIPVSQFSKKVALQQADEVFVPAHDAYSIAKVFAARPPANVTVVDVASDDLALKFNQTVDFSRTGGGQAGKLIAWVSYDFASRFMAEINFTGSDQGYKEAKNGYLGVFKGVKLVEVPDAYLGTGIYALLGDKRAIINVKPKMNPKGDGVVVLEKVPGFSGIEIQLRDRGDTFVLNKKARTIASLQSAASTTTTTTTA